MTRSAGLLGAAGTGALIEAQSSRGESGPDSPQQQRDAAQSAALAARVPFDGEHQAGILTPAPAQATFAALDSLAPDALTLRESLQALSQRARQLATGGKIGLLEVDDPPPDSGVLGPYNSPDSTTVTIAFGASLFDHRYGLGRRRPRSLVKMPTFSLDELDPAQSHGDILLQINANQRDTVVHTLRELLRTVRGTLELRWAIDGFKGAARGPSDRSSPRNLFAFRDGTANPSVDDAELMRRLVWAGSGEPAWAGNGTYQVVRIIRMHTEFWDRVGLSEQEEMIGRRRTSGAPLGGTDEFEDPRYELDPHGERIRFDSHIRLANPRSAATADQRFLRRGFNFHRGFDQAGQLDQGLVFVAFNQDPARQFAVVQRRLASEPMTDYISHVGGGYFFAPRGAKNSADWVGSALFA